MDAAVRWLDDQFEADHELLVRYKACKWSDPPLSWADRERLDELREEHHDALMVQMFCLKEETDDPEWYELGDAWRPRAEHEWMMLLPDIRIQLPDLDKWIPETL